MILIAGGAGYIGSHTNKILNKSGYNTVIFDDFSRGHKSFVKWGVLEEGSLADKKRIREVFKRNKIVAVMHFSAFCLVSESVAEPSKYYSNNVVNTINLLDVMEEFGAKKFIFSSTCATYGNPLEIPISENHPQNPINPYGRTKLMVEQILKDYDNSYGIKCVNLRYFNAAGADPETEIGELHEPETHLIPLALDAAAGKREGVAIFGNDYETKDGTCVRDYIHVNDLAEAHKLALKYLLEGGESDSFNLGNGNGFSVKEIIDISRKITGKKIKAFYAPKRDGDPAILIGSSEKIQKTLSWKPKFGDINTIIETAWNWHRKIYGSWHETMDTKSSGK